MTTVVMEMPDHLAPYARRVRAGTLDLHCYVGGPADAPPLLLIHGLADEADSWRRIFLPLAERYRVVAPDLPGFGRSAHPSRAYTVPFFARSVAALMDSLAIGRATVMGSSMGAMVAHWLAVAAPVRVERLVLLDGCLPVERSFPSGPIWAFLTPGVGEASYTNLRRSQDEAYATLRPYYADLDALPADERDFLRRRVWARVWSDTQRRAFFSALRWMALDAAARHTQYRAAVAACPTPAQLIWGEQDHIIPQASAAAALALMPAARSDSIANCGHLPQQECPDELLALLS